MGAGLSKQQINRRIRYHLQRIAYRLELAGVRTVYQNYQVFPDLSDLKTRANADIEFNISFNTYRASNAEVAGFPRIIISVNGMRQTFGHMCQDGDFEKGIERIKQVYADFVIKGAQ